MSKSSTDPGSLRNLIHDLNGELFLIRGYLDLIHGEIKDNQQVMDNYDRIQERLNEVERIIKNMRGKQQELEP